jgi:hypothetical protein
MFKVCRSRLSRLRHGSGATDSDTSRECSSAAVGCDAAALVPLAFVNVTRCDGTVKGHWRTLACPDRFYLDRFFARAFACAISA